MQALATGLKFPDGPMAMSDGSVLLGKRVYSIKEVSESLA